VKILTAFMTLLITLGMVVLSFSPGTAPAAAPASGMVVALEPMRGSDLAIWDGPYQGGPSIQVPAPENRGGVILQSTGLVFDVTWSGSWPPAAQTAFNYALSLWSSHLEDTGVTVTITATWKSLGSSGPLGLGGPTLGYCTSGCPYNYTYYPAALLDKLFGGDVFPGTYDISTTYNSDKAGDFYYGLDGNPGISQSDFVTVVLHEVGHGLGFTGGMWVDGTSCGLPNNYPCYCDGTGKGCLRNLNGYPYIYDQFTEDAGGTSLLNSGVYPQDSLALGAALQSNNLYFDGPQANAGNGGGRVPIYAPGSWQSGSSYSHLHYSTYYGSGNSLMTYMLTDGDAFHDPGPVTLGIFEDIGWGMRMDKSVFMPVLFK
jgi:hypothetical protein